MTMYYAHIDQAAKILGWYCDAVHTDIPQPNVPCDVKTWQAALNINANYYNCTTGKFESHDFRTTDEREIDEARQIRSVRNNKLREIDQIVTNPLRWQSLSDKERDDIAAYRQSLLDVPQQDAFPNNVEWATPPTLLK